jgi:hypothetical protein
MNDQPSRCDSGACVQVELVDGEVRVSDSKDPGPTLTYPAGYWQVRCDAMRNAAAAEVTYWLPSGVHNTGVGYTWTRDRVTLSFSVAEWAEFHTRVLSGDYDVETLTGERTSR